MIFFEFTFKRLEFLDKTQPALVEDKFCCPLLVLEFLDMLVYIMCKVIVKTISAKFLIFYGRA
jgi:hypothetical protein